MEYNEIFYRLCQLKPSAQTNIAGGQGYSNLKGIVNFYALANGVVVMADIEGLPKTNTNIFAFHIHEGESCEDDFSKTGGHFNPKNQPHPNHAGDMPPLFSNNGDAWFCFYTTRFKIEEIIGKTVIIHEGPDDFTTQPSGNSGNKIACGVIKMKM